MTEDRTRTRSSLAMTLAFISTSIINYAFSLAMARILLPGDFGVLAFAQTVLLIGGLVLETGVPWALARYVATAGAPSNQADAIRSAIRTNFVLAICLDAALIAFYALGPLRQGFETLSVLVVVLMAFPMISVTGVAKGAFQGVERFGLLAMLQVTEVTGKALASTLLVILGYGVAGAVLGFAIGATLSTALGLAALSRLKRLSPNGSGRSLSLRSVLPMFAALLGAALLVNLDFAAVKLLDGQARALAGLYQATVVLSNAPYFLVASVVVPMVFARLARHERLGRSFPALAPALRVTLTLIVPLELSLAAAPRAFLHTFFPPEYGSVAQVLQLRALGIAAFTIAVVLAAAYEASGRAGRVARVMLGVAGLEVVAVAVIGHPTLVQAALGLVASTLAVLFVIGADLSRFIPRSIRCRAAKWLLRYSLALGAGFASYWATAELLSVSSLAAVGASWLLYGGTAWMLGLLPPFAFVNFARTRKAT